MEMHYQGKFMKKEKPQQKESWQRNLYRDAKEFIYVIAVFMLIYVLMFRMVEVNGSSMFGTLMHGDRVLLVSGILYHSPQQGDIVVASKDSFRGGECIIKRVIATEGQTVDIDFNTGNVYVDGELLHEPYISSPTTLSEGTQFPLTVDEGCVFVMGDNRIDSMDSRNPNVGQIDEREILGKAIFLVFPGSGERGDLEPDFGRIGVID